MVLDESQAGGKAECDSLATLFRWLFYPPDVIPPGVRVTANEDGDQEVECPNPTLWLLTVKTPCSHSPLRLVTYEVLFHLRLFHGGAQLPTSGVSDLVYRKES